MLTSNGLPNGEASSNAFPSVPQSQIMQERLRINRSSLDCESSDPSFMRKTQIQFFPKRKVVTQNNSREHSVDSDVK